MRKILIVLVSLFFWNLEDTFAQKSKKQDTFPTYEQIRGNRNEIYDFVDPRAAAAGQKPAYKVISPYYDAFNYPADSTTYYLNGRKVKNKKVAEAQVKEKAGNIERVMVGEVDESGMRVIEIDYEPKKE